MTNEQRIAEAQARKAHHATAARSAMHTEPVPPQQPVVATEPGATPPVVPAVPAPAATTPVAPAAPVVTPAPAATTPAPVTAKDVFAWGFEPGDEPVPAAAPAATTVPDPAVKSARELELESRIAELETSNTNLTAAQQRELEQRNAELEELEQLRAFKRQQETAKLLAMDGIEFENLDPEMARELSQKYLAPVLQRQQEAFEAQTTKMAQRLDELAKSRQTDQERQTEQQRTEVLTRTNSAIFAAHPDFQAIQQSPEFQRVLAQRVKGSRTKLSDIAASEYHAGNAQFIVDLVTQFKAGRPSLEDIASATTSGTGTIPATETGEPEFSSEDVQKWNAQVATGELSREDYRKNMAKYREQRSRQSA